MTPPIRATTRPRPASSDESAASRWVEWAWIVAGAALLVLMPHHAAWGDGGVRFQALSALLEEGHLTGTPYSLVGPLGATPLWLMGRAWGAPERWCSYYNFVLLIAGLMGSYRLLATEAGTSLARRFVMVALFGSMLPHYQLEFGGEMFSVVMLTIGSLGLLLRYRWWGGVAIALGVANTPATALGAAVLVAVGCWRHRRWRLAWLALAAVALVLIENWLRRGHPLSSGYEGNRGFATFMPYSGLPGFSYPLLFGVLSLLLSFGKGLLWYAPGLLLSPRRYGPMPTDALRWTVFAWLCCVAGLVLAYAKWWSWYGGMAWGPRFLLFASVPASWLLTVRLRDDSAPVVAEVLTLVVLVLSCWVGVDGLVFGQSNMGICLDDDARLEVLCWYTPEFSALFRPFVAPAALPVVKAAALLVWSGALTYLAAPVAARLVARARWRLDRVRFG